MKLFDFYCKDCDKSFEKLVKTTERVECPFCGSTNTQQQLAPLSIKVGGVGAYSNKMKL